MGLTINYRHRTKSLKKIQELIQDLKAYAETTQRGFQWGVEEGYYRKGIMAEEEQNPIDAPYNYFWVPKGIPGLLGEKTKPTKSIYFEMELKSPLGAEGNDWMGVRWVKVGDYWIANDWSKPTRPRNDKQETQVAKRVIEEIGFLEYIKKFYFPDFKIDDEFDFHINYKDKTEAQKQFWRDIKAGNIESYRREDGTFPDYKAKYLAKKHHDIKNIYESFGEINKVFSKIDKMMLQAGWNKDQIARDVSIKKPRSPGIQETSIPIGDQLVNELHDNIRGVKINEVRKRMITIPNPKRPINKVLKRRKDGVRQHYYKRLPRK